MNLDLSEERLIFFSISPIITIIDFRIKFEVVVSFAFCDLRESAVGSVITSLLKKCGYGNNFFGEVDFKGTSATAMMLRAYGSLIHTCDHSAARDGANGAGDKGMGKASAFSCQLIKVGCCDCFFAIAAKMCGHVFNHDPDNVGFTGIDSVGGRNSKCAKN